MTRLHKSARWYASHGWAVLPLHEPLFANGQCIGCTCEAWRRENINPDYDCKTPGKHPRHSAWETIATVDLGQIDKWWRAWPNANIGIAAGKSGLVCLDADTYKDGADLEPAEKQTVTSLTGGGGEHLIYQHPADGPPLGNATGNLPHWIDVRGHGGLFVAPPSLHPSGQAYQWEEEYGPHQIEPLPLPEPIRAVLTEAAENAAQGIELDEMEAVDLGDLRLPNWTAALLAGDRSRIDSCVVVALVRAGATDAQIFYLFSNNPPTSKFSEYNGDGKRYLELTISNARQFVASRARPTFEPRTAAA